MGVCSPGEAVPEVCRSEAASSNPCTSVYMTLGPVTADFFLPPLQGPSFLLSLSPMMKALRDLSFNSSCLG